jgi:hypothetical protein
MNLKLSAHQPYFFPYIGYFQLMNLVDEFVVYDNIEFTKKGWINRNRILVNGSDAYITLPLKKNSDYLEIKDRYLSDDWKTESKKMLNRITESYRKAPYFESVFPLIEKTLLFADRQLFNFIFNSLCLAKDFLDIKTSLIISSTLPIDHHLKSTEKVITLCKYQNAKTYINPIGGIQLYNKEEFKKELLELKFIKTNHIIYPQFKNEFIPYLSIIDMMMFNSKVEIKNHLNNSFTYL